MLRYPVLGRKRRTVGLLDFPLVKAGELGGRVLCRHGENGEAALLVVPLYCLPGLFTTDDRLDSRTRFPMGQKVCDGVRVRAFVEFCADKQSVVFSCIKHSGHSSGLFVAL